MASQPRLQHIYHCRAAIAVNPARYAAHKNLALAFQGLGHWEDAVMSFAEATRLDRMNACVWQSLEHVLQGRPTLLNQYPELRLLTTDLRRDLEDGNQIQPPIESSPMFRMPDISGEH